MEHSDRVRVLEVIGSLGGGGGERQLCSLVERLDRSVFDVSVCPLWPILDLAPHIQAAGVPIVPIHKRSRYDWSIVPRLGRYIRAHGIDIVHTHMQTANIWGRLAAIWGGAPVRISTEQVVPTHTPAILWLFERSMLPATAAVVAVSEGTRSWYVRNVKRASRKCVLIYNSANLERFDRRRLAESGPLSAKALGLECECVIVGTVAGFRPQKNYPNLLKAARLVCNAYPDVHFVAVGEGQLRGEIERLIDELDLVGRVTLTGYVEKPELVTSLFDVFVLASDTEGLSLAMLEAMALEIPVVATDVAGAREVLGDNGFGLLVPPRSPERLAEAICRLIQEPAQARAMGKRARVRVQARFSAERMAHDYEDLYLRALSKHKRRGFVQPTAVM